MQIFCLCSKTLWLLLQKIWLFGWVVKCQIFCPNFVIIEIFGNIRVALKCSASSFPGIFQSSIFLLSACLLETICDSGCTWKSSKFQIKMYIESTKPHHTWLHRNFSAEQEKTVKGLIFHTVT